MTNLLLILPVLIPFFTGVITLIARSRYNVQRMLGVGGTVLLLLSGLALLHHVWYNGIAVSEMGGWPAPYSIVFVADLFSAIMVVMAGIVSVSVGVYSLVGIDSRRVAYGYFPLFNIMLMGVCGAFLTGDIFNLYVWFEVLLISSFVLMALGGERAQLEGAIKYVTLNLLSSALFLAGVGILYGSTGTLNMAELARLLGEVQPQGLVTTLSILFLIAFGIKAAIFPLFFWLPASYHTPPVAVTAIFAGLLTKVGVYALVRVFTLLFVHDVAYTHTLILILAGFTMVTGVLGAVAQNEVRRLLSFHIVSQIGYLIMGLGIFTALSLAGTVFFMAHVIIAKSALFLVSGVAYRTLGTYDLKKMGGLFRSFPLLSILFLIPALALAGIPPLSGFFAKVALVLAGFEAGQYAVTATALFVSILTLFSMMKIWTEAFWKPLPASPNVDLEPTPPRDLNLLLGPIIAMAGMNVLMGLAAYPLFQLALRAGEQLMDRSAYITAVLGVPH
jgi:multicomponent Na+:H+ antiporter subunit D